MGKIVNNGVMTLHGDRWLLDICSVKLMYADVKSLCSTPETAQGPWILGTPWWIDADNSTAGVTGFTVLYTHVYFLMSA